MKARILAATAVVALALIAQTKAETSIAVTSSAFESGSMIPLRFTCKGENESPPLAFKGIPAAAKSLALIIDDPDAPGGVFSHWLVWNIDPSAKQIPVNTVPVGAAQGQNDFGKPGYGGPCPPSLHRYFFRIFALDKKLDLKSGAKRSALDGAMAGHVIGRGELTARFGR
jgi:Raf kinase inhibitor-like YbhB/YbcL family protein